ncbi:hypothetical protein K1T71_014251 [Dendrolimus kikuchii]|uniref:Uncharacterized protein n=1 Tax=Dendrolimus kikuchii TaxID=765133 RepID=A0ACC1CFM5_9NEOP|nr:hypothetical protein K1T71_014251 [Dendrolimus kikuchii]
MVKLILTIICVIVCYQPSSSQCLRSQPYNIINRQIPEIMETSRIIQSPTVITDPPVNIVPIPGPSPSTTIITDCSPAVCKNLANTIQLMIVTNLLQNSKLGSDMAMQLVGPILNEVVTSPVLSCGCSNPISPSMVTPSVITPSIVTPNIVTPNIVTPNLLTSMFSPNFVESSNFMSPNLISPISTIPASISTIPASLSSVSPISNINYNNSNGLLKSIISLLGNRMQM